MNSIKKELVLCVMMDGDRLPQVKELVAITVVLGTGLMIKLSIIYLIIGLLQFLILWTKNIKKNNFQSLILGLIFYPILWPCFIINRLVQLSVLKRTLKPFKILHFILFNEIVINDDSE